MPILIGVIVLGFVIGAGLSLAGRHDTAVVALASPSAVPSVTFAPVTPAPTEKPTPEPTPGPSSRADVAAAPAEPASPAAAPAEATVAPLHPRRHHRVPAPLVALATAAPVATPATSEAKTKPKSGAEADATLQPQAEPEPSAAPRASLAAAPTETPAPLATQTEGDTAFASLSAAVVRQYLEAIKRGDEDGAYAALGSTPGAKGQLTESGVVDSRTHVGRIDAHSAANDDALVSVQLSTSSGPYFGQFTVHKTDTGAAVIVAHSIVKP